jgi:hypothetical protein
VVTKETSAGVKGTRTNQAHAEEELYKRHVVTAETVERLQRDHSTDGGSAANGCSFTGELHG